jgi:hypothetical protein
MPQDEARKMLRHTLATLAYRAGKTLRGAPAEFAAFRIGDKGRSAGEILAHMSDLMDWALSIARSKPEWHDSPTLLWHEGSTRFYLALQAIDQYLACAEMLGCSPEMLFQGPIADALTHTGQLAMLRRLAGSSIKGENYFKADIAEGRVGPDQTAPRREFD